jgi:SAM-dependent methyltransferase
MDLRFGGRICRTNLDGTPYTDGRHTMVHSDYHVLKDIFAHVAISDRDVLVDVGCGEGRVINFWLSLGLKNRIVGIEFVREVAQRARARYRKYPNVSIVEGDALANLPTNGTVFFLYNPFSEETVACFERVVRGLDARIIYYTNNYMAAFENGCWDVKTLEPQRRIYEFRAAMITRRAS